MTIEQKIQAGNTPLVGKKILHTAPHHDDILLGYFPYLLRNLQGNEHHVLYLTSGANGVSDQFLAQYQAMSSPLASSGLRHKQELKGRIREVESAMSSPLASSGLRRKQELKGRIREVESAMSSPLASSGLWHKQELKSRIRQAESAKKWAMVAPGQQISITNFRSKFYMTPQISSVDLSDDLQRLVDHLHHTQPDIITVLTDEVGCGPQTHHQAAELMLAAIAKYQETASKELVVLGYRNIWSSFSVEQASMIIPVSQRELEQVESIFQQCFLSQCNKLIMMPDSDPHDLMTWKNFAQLATAIMREQNMQIYMQVIKNQRA